MSLRALSIAAATVLAITAAQASTFTYELNGDANEASTGAANALVTNGGSFDATGYIFGPNQGLTFNSPIGFDGTGAYSVETRFSFSETAGFRKVLDFKNRLSDTGFYNFNGTAVFYNAASGGSTVF